MKYARHIHVLELLASIPRKEIEPNWNGARRIGVVTPDEAIAVWDHLFGYIHENWEIPTSASASWYESLSGDQRAEVDDCRSMLEMNCEELEARLRTLPPYFTEYIFPIAVGRYLLRDLWLPFDHRKSRTFTEFHNRYGKMILG